MGLWQQSWGQPQAVWLLCSFCILESRLTSFSIHRPPSVGGEEADRQLLLWTLSGHPCSSGFVTPTPHSRVLGVVEYNRATISIWSRDPGVSQPQRLQTDTSQG